MELAGGQTIPFVIDTGMNTPGIGEVNQKTFNMLVNQGHVKIVGPLARMQTVAGLLTSRKGQLDRFCIDEFEHKLLGIREGKFNAMRDFIISPGTSSLWTFQTIASISPRRHGIPSEPPLT